MTVAKLRFAEASIATLFQLGSSWVILDRQLLIGGDILCGKESKVVSRGEFGAGVGEDGDYSAVWHARVIDEAHEGPSDAAIDREKWNAIFAIWHAIALFQFLL